VVLLITNSIFIVLPLKSHILEAVTHIMQLDIPGCTIESELNFISCHLSCDHLSLSLALMRSCLSVHFLARSQHSIQQKLQIKHLYVLTKTNLAD